MPYRPKDIYRGRRKFRVPLNIFLFVLAFVIIGGVAMFYILQQYIVYDVSGVSLQLPFGREEEPPAVTEVTPEPTFEPIEVEIIWENPDFEDVDMGTWDELEPIQGRFIPLGDVMNASSLGTIVSEITGGGFYTAAVLEMKDRSGQLAWPSTAATALSFATYGTADVSEVVERLHEAGKLAIAQISCFADNLLISRNWTVALQSNGAAYRDSNGVSWLDPYNQTVRTYITDLAQELAAMGFDEVILADLYHPISEAGFTYTATLRTPADPVVAVCQAGRRVAEALEGTGTAVSVRVDPGSLRGNLGSQTGQDMDIFWRLFARLYCATSPDIMASDKELAIDKINGGNDQARFVPIVGLIPEGSQSYVIAG